MCAWLATPAVVAHHPVHHPFRARHGIRHGHGPHGPGPAPRVIPGAPGGGKPVIHIAFVIDTIESATAGTERQLLHLLERLDRTRFAPVLCVLRPSDWIEQSVLPCPVYNVSIRGFKHPASIAGIGKFSGFLRGRRIDVVQTHFRDSTIASVCASRLAGKVPVIATRRNQGYWQTGLDKRLQPILNRLTTAFIANSRSTMDKMVRDEGIAPERIRIIPNGLDLSKFPWPMNGDRESTRQALGMSRDEISVGIVANLRPIKRHDLLIEAAAIVRGRHPNARFHLFGDGDEREKLEALVRERALDGVIRFHGRCENVPAMLPGLDIGVLCSDSESMSNAVIEYMAAGLPVVATNVGGVGETIVDGVTGSLVPAGDYSGLANAIARFAADASLRNTTGQSGRRKAEGYSLDQCVAAHESLYAAIAGSAQ
ncbi:glycosyltransferase [Oceanidesulfovibrio marinus]|uniref:Glycosyltransferase n=1 Tax=Oceanidesulfovibrio marinus TaxID=370038 RepID=A0ABX6NDX1_9BACT|nr:glycosyltransferase [Oceanidesulfovibrio marinus]